MRCIPGSFAFVCLALVCAAPAYSVQLLYETVTIAPTIAPGMNGPSEPQPSPGTGYGTALYDNVAHTLTLDCTFSGLDNVGSTGVTASHIHAPTAAPFSGTAGVATTTPSFAGFPTGVFSGSFHSVLDLTQSSSWNPAYVTANGGTNAGAETAFALALSTGQSYWNIHSSKFGGGEIRGFMRLVPEPASCVLVGLGVLGLASISRRRS
jgi:CHRD domain-containing protein